MWFLARETLAAFERAHAAGVIPDALQEQEYRAQHSSDSGRVLRTVGNNAEVIIHGVLTKSPSLLAMLFGGGNTTYGEIVDAIATAEQDDAVDNITLAIDSPGGAFDGMFDAIAALQTAKKPIRAVIANLGASAAYALASQAGEIVAGNKSARIGSIGVAADFWVDENEVSIASSAAPKKRPDVTTAEGRAIVREELDALHELFVDTIATGRDTTVDIVNANFGQGATLLAEEAQRRGMIDAVLGAPTLVRDKPTTARSTGAEIRGTVMDIDTLRTQHPDVYAAAVQIGVNEERDRVTAHLVMGEASGDWATAHAAAQDGSAMTGAIQAKYMAAGMNRRDMDTRADDETNAGGGDDADPGTDPGATVASLVEEKMGVSRG
jgi:ClpP class serine protease